MKRRRLYRKFRSSFQLRIFIAFALVITIFIPGTGYVGYLQALKIAEQQMEQYAIGTASQITKRVNSFLAHHNYNVTLLASMIEKQLISPADADELLLYFRLFQKGHPEFINIYYGDEHGRFFMVPPQLPEVHKIFDPRTRPWYTGAISTITTHWTDVYLFASTQKPGLTVSAPVYTSYGLLRGICGIDIDLIAFSKFISEIDIGGQGVAYIFENTSGHIIAHPWLTKPSGLEEKLRQLREARVQLDKQQASYGLTTHDGEQLFTAYNEFAGKNWTVGVTLSTEDYLKKIGIIKATTIILVIAGIVLSSIFSLLLSKNIIRPLLKLQQGIDRISRGELEPQVKIKDPDIARDLALSFNRMALSLRTSLIELKATYAELQEKQKLAAVGTMTAGIAHELKNPLGIILGSTQVVLDRQRPWEMREKAASFIMDEVVRLDTTLKTFLAFAKPATPVFDEIDLIALLNDTLTAVEEKYSEAGFKILTDFPGEVPLIEADPGQIKQIFINLLLNAFDSMEGGGTATIIIRTEREPKAIGDKTRFISIRNPFTVDRDWLIISITDEGCGIEETQIDKIMDPFVSYRDDGVGLGLSIVSQLVKLHRGHIEITSIVGEGTTFTLYFPCILKESKAYVKPVAH